MKLYKMDKIIHRKPTKEELDKIEYMFWNTTNNSDVTIAKKLKLNVGVVKKETDKLMNDHFDRVIKKINNNENKEFWEGFFE